MKHLWAWFLGFQCKHGKIWIHILQILEPRRLDHCVSGFNWVDTDECDIFCVMFQDFGGQTNGGIISALILLGVRQPIINTYKQVLGASTDVCQDFALYFFAFVITHVLIWMISGVQQYIWKCIGKVLMKSCASFSNCPGCGSFATISASLQIQDCTIVPDAIQITWPVILNVVKKVIIK